MQTSDKVHGAFFLGLPHISLLRGNMNTSYLCIGLLLVTAHVSFIATATRIFCRAPISPDEPASIICHFPENVNQSKTSFSLLRLSYDGSSAEQCLGCTWKDGQPLCDGEEGFQLISQVSSNATFAIPPHKHGTFLCDTIPPNKTVTLQSCNFTVLKDVPGSTPPPRSDLSTSPTERSQEPEATRTFCRVPPIPEGDPANLICHFPEDLSQNRKGIAVFRRDSIPGSQYKFLAGCAWSKEKLLCGNRREIKLVTRQPMYDVTFEIESRQPGTFLCNSTKDKAVTVQSCNFTLNGSDSSRNTTERTQRQNEDGGPFDVITIVVIAVILSVITTVAVTLLIQRFCRCRSCGSASSLVLKHGKGESQTELATKEIQPSESTSVEDPEHSVGQTPYQLVEEESQPSESTSVEDPEDSIGQTQCQLVEVESQSGGSASPLVQKHGKGESQTELAMKEIQPAGNVLVGEPKSTKGKAKCK